jgi:beta-glucanase (GH16 family)
MNTVERGVLLALWGGGWVWTLSVPAAPLGAVENSTSPRLPDRGETAAPPPTVVRGEYPIDDKDILKDSRFDNGAGGAAERDSPRRTSESERNQLTVRTKARQDIACGAILSDRSYSLKFRAKKTGGGFGSVAIRFKENEHHGTVRTYEKRVVSDASREYVVEFTAPTYACDAEVVASSDGGDGLAVNGLSLKMREPLPRSEAVLSWARSYVPEGYTLVFNDEFSGKSLDRSRWFTRYVYGSERLDHLHNERQKYADNQNHEVRDGVLKLVARRVSPSEPSGRTFESGMIRSDWTVRYGFFEARVKMPSARGVWPAFWLNSDVSETGRLGWPPEIDIFEFVNNVKDDKVNMIHMAASTLPGQKAKFSFLDKAYVVKWQDYVAPFNFDEDWHTIGAEWTSDSVSSYIDGVKVATRSDFQWNYNDGSLAAPAHIILNLAIGGSWAGRYGVDEDAFPQALQVDWVRVYRRSDEVGRDLAPKGCACLGTN